MVMMMPMMMMMMTTTTKSTSRTTISSLLLLLLLNLNCFSTIHAFTLLPSQICTGTQQLTQQQKQDYSLKMFFADETPAPAPAPAPAATSSSSSITAKLSISDGTEESLQKAAAFMVDSFWLNSPQGLIEGGGTTLSNTDDNDNDDNNDIIIQSLVDEQFQGFVDTYGEIMGKRILPTALIQATQQGDDDDNDNNNNNNNNGDLLGLVSLEVCLYRTGGFDVVSSTKSQQILQNTVASLGPKQRRQYKNASVRTIASQLLPPDVNDIVILSNLVVSPSARRRGIANQLCREAERIAKEEWGYNELFLRVETENEAARGLYENRLGFTLHDTLTDSRGIRVNAQTGKFTEVPAETLLLTKPLSFTGAI